MKVILKRKKKIFSDKNISEMVRNISEQLLSENHFGLSIFSLFEKVRMEVFQNTDGYDLNNGHFILSIFKSSGQEMMRPYEPFVIDFSSGKIVINLEKNIKIIEDLVLYIKKRSKAA